MPSSASDTRLLIHPAVELIRNRSVCVLTGAGISTESGIPDYRGPERRGRPATPITYREFTQSAEARKRYWARSAVGWPWIDARQPNTGHEVVADLERTGICSGLITQNVDGLHRVAGSRRVIELHGSLGTVACLVCQRTESRHGYQERIMVQNPGWLDHAGDVAPDGDIHLDRSVTAGFRVPACIRCGGDVKPDVVFFGETIPRPRVDAAFAMLDEAELLLVLGSSLTVYSGYRFVVTARRAGKPVVIINDGPTRADAEVDVRIQARLGEALADLRDALGWQ